MWHVSSRSDVATLQTAIHLLLTYLLTHLFCDAAYCCTCGVVCVCSWRGWRIHGLCGDPLVPSSRTTGWWHTVRSARRHVGHWLRLRRADDRSATVARPVGRRPALPHQKNTRYVHRTSASQSVRCIVLRAGTSIFQGVWYFSVFTPWQGQYTGFLFILLLVPVTSYNPTPVGWISVSWHMLSKKQHCYITLH